MSRGLRVSHACLLAQHEFCARHEVCLRMHVVHVCFQLSVMCLTVYRIKLVVRVEIFLTRVISTFLLPTIKTISGQKFFLAF